ncbi:MAG: 40-residue YVTN family beta-propeller repeat protein [Monoraphidium minutum]|nr:MAG: 40-residue YVTN family beta-propeller repeat protein [Monoraphidium minutum]
MRRSLLLLAACAAALAACGDAGQAPLAAGAPDIPITSSDRIYASCQTSNAVSVIDPAAGKLLGVIPLGDPLPAALGATYVKEALVHGLGYAPNGKTLAAVCVSSNAVVFIDTATNTVKARTYVGRAPHEAFWTPDGREVWVSVRGLDYIQVLDGKTYKPTSRITVPKAPGMTIFSPDGRYAFVCSSGAAAGGAASPDTVVIDTASKATVGRVRQGSAFCPNIAATPDGKQVWFTLKDSGRVQVISAQPPFATIATLDVGPITNHVNFASTAAGGQRAYVSVGGTGSVQVWSTGAAPKRLAVVEGVGANPHGVWPSGDGSRVYVALQGGNQIAVIDTATSTLLGRIPAGGQGPMALVYVPGAAPPPPGGGAARKSGLAPPPGEAEVGALFLDLDALKAKDGGASEDTAPAGRVTVNRQGFLDALEATITGLCPGGSYVLALAPAPGGGGGAEALEPIAGFKANADGAAAAATVGPLRRALGGGAGGARRYLVVADYEGGRVGAVIQAQRVSR